MKCLVIIPTNIHNYSFSAPIAWLFSKHKDNVKGIYGFELSKELILHYDYFIIELNWFLELKEFELIVNCIKKHNSNAKILFGGLYAALKYKDIFNLCNVDYYIQGDNEKPISLFLDSMNPREIPNFVGKDFINNLSYCFKEEDFKNLEFNLDWFPSYFKYSDSGEQYYEDISYNHLYALPMIFTSKGGCSVVHEGCGYCMGSKHKELSNIYNRPPITMSNETLISLLRKIEGKFQKASLLITSDIQYDFSGHYFDLDINIEIDANMSYENIRTMVYSFRKAVLNIAIYNEGLSGSSINMNCLDLIKLEDKNHKVNLFASNKDSDKLDIPQKHRLYLEDVFPEWSDWSFYQDFDAAYVFSKMVYSKIKNDKKFQFIY